MLASTQGKNTKKTSYCLPFCHASPRILSSSWFWKPNCPSDCTTMTPVIQNLSPLSFLSLFSREPLGIWLKFPIAWNLTYFLWGGQYFSSGGKRNHSTASPLWRAQPLILRESFCIKPTAWSLYCNSITLSDPYPSSSPPALILWDVGFFSSFFYHIPILLLHPTQHFPVLFKEDLLLQGHLYSAICWIIFSQCVVVTPFFFMA